MATDYLTPILEANGAFFAFSKDQFNEKKKEGVIKENKSTELIWQKETILETNGTDIKLSKKKKKKKKKEGVIYVNMGAGLICPKEKADKLHAEVKRNSTKAIKAELKKKGAKAIIRHEYFNHECQITMSTEDAENALKRYIEIAPKEFTKELISETFKECLNEAIEKDLF